MLKMNLLRAANCRQSKARAQRQRVQNDLCSQQELYLHTAEAVLTPTSNTNVLFTLRRLETNLCQMYAHVTRRRVGRHVLQTFWKRL
jgi:hypothetical protein